ncbi:MAG: hypothetical protein HKN19_04190 [Halioglobus sp.]|nr:hypothetical protein [Halioglobus sp.]
MATFAAARRASNPTSTQDSKILPGLFAGLDEDSRLSVLHVGPTCSDTLDFFAEFRSRLYIVDVFTELPLHIPEDEPADFERQWRDILQLPTDTRFNLCLFWDLFNFLSAEALAALMTVLEPQLHEEARGHAFSVHNPRHSLQNCLYGIRDAQTLSTRARHHTPPGYAPLSQRQLSEALGCMDIERSVLLADSRLELSLRAKKTQN